MIIFVASLSMSFENSCNLSLKSANFLAIRGAGARLIFCIISSIFVQGHRIMQIQKTTPDPRYSPILDHGDGYYPL